MTQVEKNRAEISDPGRRPARTDLAFWSVTSAVVAAFSAPLARMWGAPRVALLGVAAVVLVAGVAGLVALRRLRRVPTRLVRTFGLANLAITPVALAAAVLNWLRLTATGNAALTVVAVIALLFGTWQLLAEPSGQRG